MLKNRYQEILVGSGYVPLIRGLISLKQGRSILLIDDDRFSQDSYHQNFLSELEVLSLTRLGERHSIPELIDIRRFLSTSSVEFVNKDFRLKLGQSPFVNLKEVLRKFPELLPMTDLDLVYNENPEEFNHFFHQEMIRYEAQCFEYAQRSKALRFQFRGPKWFIELYKKFAELINSDYSTTQNLKYASLLQLLSLSSEERLRSYLAPEELPFYFFRLFSPQYRLQDVFLSTQLRRRLNLWGGDYKQSTVQFWQFHNHRFENLLLASFEGVISGSRVLFFSYLPENLSFKLKGQFPFLRKNQIYAIKASMTAYPANKITYFSESTELGTSHPYRVLTQYEGGFKAYDWPYPHLLGSKAEFYNEASQGQFLLDASNYPFTVPGTQMREIGGVTMDLRQVREFRKVEAPLRLLLSDIAVEKDLVQGFEYWGPHRYNILGFLGLIYGIEAI